MWIRLAMAIGAVAASLPAQDFNSIEAVVETDAGSFRIEFAADKAPKHVAFFVDLVKKGYYSGSGFHRVFGNALIQGGDPLLKDPKTPSKLWGTGGLRLQKSEFSDMKHERGVVSAVSIPNMADSDGAQFFVCLAPQPALDGNYSAFGRVTEGLDVVEKISNAAAEGDGLVKTPPRILRVTIEKKKVEPYLTATSAEMKKTVTIVTTVGTMRVALEPEWAPETVRNFLKLSATGWYEGTQFHRIAKGFVVQGGSEGMRLGSQAHAADRWVRPVKGEFSAPVKHDRGILSMARAEDPNSATTSFFVVLAPSPHLDKNYAAFGRVIEGMETIEAFEKEEVDGETPKRRLEIVKVTIE